MRIIRNLNNVSELQVLKKMDIYQDCLAVALSQLGIYSYLAGVLIFVGIVSYCRICIERDQGGRNTVLGVLEYFEIRGSLPAY